MKELNPILKLIVINRRVMTAYLNLWMKAIGQPVYNKWESQELIKQRVSFFGEFLQNVERIKKCKLKL